uniref:Cell surface protein n=1 Tax=Fervidobacterium pennivorans TaxID=93466 RepID=A0A7V4KBS3_FERPE
MKLLVFFAVVSVLAILSCTPNVVDNTVPQVKIAHLEHNAFVSGTITVTVEATDISGILKVELYLDDTKVGEKLEKPYTFELNTKSYPDGNYTLVAKAYDRSNNVGQTSVSITIDNTAPVVSIASPNEGETVHGTLTINYIATDGTGIDKVELLIDNRKFLESTEESGSFEVNTKRYSNGQHQIELVAYDRAGNMGKADLTVNIENEFADGEIKWTLQTGGIIDSSPAIDSKGIIYIGSEDSKLYAIAPEGIVLWSFDLFLHGDGYSEPIYSAPAIGEDGTIYVSARYLYAVNPDGTLKWKYGPVGAFRNSPAIGKDGTIYVASEGGTLYAISSNGELKWTYEMGNDTWSSPSIDASETIYIGNHDGYLYAIDTEGKLKWKFFTSESESIYSAPAIASDGTVYFGTVSADNCYIYAITSEATQAILKWKYKTEWHVYASPVLGPDGTVYVGSWDKTLYAVKDGSLKWTLKTNERIWASPIVASDGTIYVAGLDNYLYALDSNGTEKWRVNIGCKIWSSPTLSMDGTIYFGGEDWKIYAVQTKSSGIAENSWAKFRGNLRNTGNLWDIGVNE